jgi:hypothetical protein
MTAPEAIVADIRERGDAALAEWAVRLDGVPPAPARPQPEALPLEALLDLAERVRAWHAAQRPADLRLEVAPGVELERRWVALDSVGIYVPRGLVSTLVMCAVPAQVAGVRRIAVTTPPSGAGLISAAARTLGIEEVWALGGPPAIAALAYGTGEIACVDKIVGLDEPAHGVRSVLGLGGQLELGHAPVGIPAHENEDLRGTGGEVYRHVPRDRELRRVHGPPARADDLVYAGDLPGAVR